MLINKIYTYARNILALKHTDIFLVSFPKSGNTWVRFYFCNLINQLPASHFTDEPIDFKLLDHIMPELGNSNLTEKWPFKGFPRIIKTHLPYKFLLGNRKSILVMRDPRDVMVSFYKFEMDKSDSRFDGTLQEFIRHPKFGVVGWCEHYLSWMKHANLIIKYEDIKVDDRKIFAAVNNFLELDVEEEYFTKALELSRFENIKKIESTKGMAIPTKFGNNFKFARSGKMGQWKDTFTMSDLQFVKETLLAYKITLYDFD